MAAPTPTPRGTPAGGVAQREGFSNKITLAANPTIAFWEKDAQPPGLEGGEPIPQTTQFNVAVHTKWPRTLYDVEPISCNVAYSPNVIAQIMALINKNDVITVTFGDGGTICFWGYLRSFKAAQMKEGEQPMAVVVFVPTNLDSSYVEQVPVETAPAGT